MATGITKLHSKSCPAKQGARCRCGAGYEASVYLAREQKKIRKTFRREAEAKSWRSEGLLAAKKGALRPISRDTRTVAVALEKYVVGMIEGTVRPKGGQRYKPNTTRSYERAVRLFVAGADLGCLRVGDVRRSDVQDFVDDLLAEGKKPRSVSNVLNPLQAFFRLAVHRDELAFNPTEGIDVPTGTSDRPRRIVSPAEARALLTALPVEDRAVWATTFYAGLRRGELQALRVADVDIASGLIHVRKGWDQVEGEIEPKSSAGRRTVALIAILRDHLDEHLLRSGRTGSDLIFGRSARQAFYPSTVDGRAKRVWAAHNDRQREAATSERRDPELLPQITMHECRHTFASLLIDTGANPKAIQEAMGHSKIQTTFDIYGHLLPGSHDDVRARLDAYLAEPSSYEISSEFKLNPTTSA